MTLSRNVLAWLEFCRKKKNLEFNITWCETNLRWLYGEPPSEDRDRNIALNISEIDRLRIVGGQYEIQGW